MFVIRDRSSFKCQLDDTVYPFTDPATKEQARINCQAHADNLIYEQTQAGVRRDATLTERRLRAGMK